MAAAAGLWSLQQARPALPGRPARQQSARSAVAGGRCRARLPLCRAQAVPPRPFGGLPDGAGRQQPPPSQALAAGAQLGAAAEQQQWAQAEVPALAEQVAALSALLQQLGRAATYAGKVRRRMAGGGIWDITRGQAAGCLEMHCFLAAGGTAAVPGYRSAAAMQTDILMGLPAVRSFFSGSR